jgi:hypothetical protein
MDEKWWKLCMYVMLLIVTCMTLKFMYYVVTLIALSCAMCWMQTRVVVAMSMCNCYYLLLGKSVYM